MWEMRDTERRQIKVNEKTTWAYVVENPCMCGITSFLFNENVQTEQHLQFI